MRVICNSVEEVLQELNLGKVHQDTVRVSRTVREERPHVNRVNLHITAVIICPDETQELLEFGRDCGKDYTDGDGDNTASKLADAIVVQVTEECNKLGLKIGPGILSI